MTTCAKIRAKAKVYERFGLSFSISPGALPIIDIWRSEYRIRLLIEFICGKRAKRVSYGALSFCDNYLLS
jgi:hypothetical protein